MLKSIRHRVPVQQRISSLPVCPLGPRAHTNTNTAWSLTHTRTLRQYSQQTAAAAAAAMGKVERITMFKIPREEDRDRALEQYKVLKRTAVKVCIHLCMHMCMYV